MGKNQVRQTLAKTATLDRFVKKTDIGALVEITLKKGFTIERPHTNSDFFVTPEQKGDDPKRRNLLAHYIGFGTNTTDKGPEVHINFETRDHTTGTIYERAIKRLRVYGVVEEYQL